MPDVLVIGAGAAGLAAAGRLRDAGAKIVVLEARPHIGGRAQTDMQRGPVELGAEFLHGDNAVTWQLLKRYGLEARRFPEHGADVTQRFVVDGNGLPAASPIDLEARIDALYSAVEGYGGRADISLDQFLTQRTTPDDAAAGFVRRRFERFEGGVASELSVAGMAQARRENTAGWTNHRITGGYHALFSAMARDLDIRVNTPVTRIDWAAGRVSATFHSGETLSAKAAVITVPVSQLQRDRIAFSPALPGWKRVAVEAVKTGPIAKVVLHFREQFWAPFAYLLLSRSMLVWWSGLPEAGPCLIGYTGGSAALQISALPAEAVIQAELTHLAALLGPRAFQMFDHGEVIDWSTTPYIEGGFTFPSVGLGDARKQLGAPVDNTLFFAGEATALGGHYATVHGAIESGWRAADEFQKLQQL
jgi:monoamine oxidase